VQQDVDLAKPHVSDLNQIFEEAERENAADRMVGRKRTVGLSSDVPAIAANSTRQTNSVLKRFFANELDIALGENDQETPVKAALAALSYGNLVGANGSRLEVPAGTSLKTIDALTERDQDERVGGYSGPWVCKSLVIAYTYRISGGRWCAVSPIR
jgi:hypothetical protein